jgi:hypothetical protein
VLAGWRAHLGVSHISTWAPMRWVVGIRPTHVTEGHGLAGGSGKEADLLSLRVRPGEDNTAQISMIVLTRSGYGGNSCSCHSACEILTAGAADSRVRLLTTGGRSSPGFTYVDPDIVPVGESAKWLKVQ